MLLLSILLTTERSERLILSACRYKLSQNSNLMMSKLIMNPGEPFGFEKEEENIIEMDDTLETVMPSGNCSKTSEEYQQDVDAWWGEVGSHNIYFSDSDEEDV